jgi:hypothetical protein
VVLVSRKMINTNYGGSQVLTFKDNNDNIYVSFYSGKDDYEDSVNEKFILTGTVKDHKEFNGIKQTILNRIIVKG